MSTWDQFSPQVLEKIADALDEQYGVTGAQNVIDGLASEGTRIDLAVFIGKRSVSCMLRDKAKIMKDQQKEP